MSKWHRPVYEDIEFCHYTNTVDIFVCSDNEGSIYVTLTFAEIDGLAEKIRCFRIGRDTG